MRGNKWVSAKASRLGYWYAAGEALGDVVGRHLGWITGIHSVALSDVVGRHLGWIKLFSFQLSPSCEVVSLSEKENTA